MGTAMNDAIRDIKQIMHIQLSDTEEQAEMDTTYIDMSIIKSKSIAKSRRNSGESSNTAYQRRKDDLYSVSR